MQFLMSSNPSALAGALANRPSASVEAEYGDVVVPGSVITMAHHGPRAGQPAPCAYPNGVGAGVEVVGLSHFDLDTLGGCAALLGRKPEAPEFWALAEYVDLNGAHKLGSSGASPEDLRRLYAFWAWSSTTRVFAPKDGAVIEVTQSVATACDVLARILQDDLELLAKGDSFKAEGERLNADSFVEMEEGVITRVSPQFTNHLYVTPAGAYATAVVAYKTLTGEITISFANPAGVSAIEIAQALWGPLAGGHAGIAGGPRDRRMPLEELAAAVAAVRVALSRR